MRRSSVVLPLPEAPSTVTISPGATSRSISRSASSRPKNLVTPRTLIDADTSARVRSASPALRPATPSRSSRQAASRSGGLAGLAAGRLAALRAAGLVEAALQRLAEVDHVGAALLGLVGDDLLAGLLGLDAVTQLLDVGVLVLLRDPSRWPASRAAGAPSRSSLGAGLDRRDGSSSISLRGTTSSAKRIVDIASTPSSGRIAARYCLLRIATRADRDPVTVLHRRQQQLVGACRRVAVGGQPVGALVVDRVDVVEGDEVADLDRSSSTSGAGRRAPPCRTSRSARHETSKPISIWSASTSRPDFSVTFL